MVCILIGNIENKSFDPSSGGIGIRLKIARRIFQKIIMMQIAKNIEPSEPERMVVIEDQSANLTFLIISSFIATGMEINLAKMAKIIAKKRLEAGPAKATSAGPHF